MSSTAQLRKIKKPLIEKKRRERMNECLNQLKTLVLEGRNTNSNESRYSKMEKVDILEMTVRYLKELRQVIPSTSGSASSIFGKYLEGYNECATHLGQYLTTAKDLSDETRQRLTEHLANFFRNSPTINSSGGQHLSPLLKSTQTTRATMMAYVESAAPFQPILPLGGADYKTLAANTSGQLPLPVSTSNQHFPKMFAILPNEVTPSDRQLTRTGSQSPSTSSPVIPLYVSSSGLSSSKHPPTQLITINKCQHLVVADNSSNAASTSCALPPALLTPTVIKSETTPAVIVFTRDTDCQSSLCSSPLQGDICPSTIYAPETTRISSRNWNSHPISGSSVSSATQIAVSPFQNENHQLARGRHVVPVWRPWKEDFQNNNISF